MRRRNPDDEDIDIESEMEDGYVISDSGPLGSRYYVDRLRREFSSMDSAVKAIAADMQREQYWPKVFRREGRIFIAAPIFDRFTGKYTGRETAREFIPEFDSRGFYINRGRLVSVK